jgi:hypothetical protein
MASKPVLKYSMQEKKMLATSIFSILAKQLELLPVASPSEALVGAEPSNPNANKGIVDNNLEPYKP